MVALQPHSIFVFRDRDVLNLKSEAWAKGCFCSQLTNSDCIYLRYGKKPTSEKGAELASLGLEIRLLIPSVRMLFISSPELTKARTYVSIPELYQAA